MCSKQHRWGTQKNTKSLNLYTHTLDTATILKQWSTKEQRLFEYVLMVNVKRLPIRACYRLVPKMGITGYELFMVLQRIGGLLSSTRTHFSSDFNPALGQSPGTVGLATNSQSRLCLDYSGIKSLKFEKTQV